MSLSPLQRIADTARRLANRVGPPTQAVPTVPFVVVQPFTFPSPDHIIPQLINVGLNRRFAEKLSQSYMHFALSLKVHYEEHLQRVTQDCVNTVHPDSLDTQTIVSSIRKAYTSHYRQKLKQWVDQSVDLSRRRVSELASQAPAAETRPSFNQETTPLLEQFFSTNAYPSREDKQSLASQTGLKFKQINIWFQNRRSRSKRDIINSRKPNSIVPSLFSPAPEPMSFPNELGNSELGSHLNDLCEEKACVAALCSSSELSAGSTCVRQASPPDPPTLSPNGPPHAFPAPYPPLCSYNPFPCKDGVAKFELPWIRLAKSHQDAPRLSTDVEELTSQLARLSLGDLHAGDEYPPSSRTLQTSTSFVVVPCPAPLPAMIRKVLVPNLPQLAINPPSVVEHPSHEPRPYPFSINARQESTTEAPTRKGCSLPQHCASSSLQFISTRQTAIHHTPSVASIASSDFSGGPDTPPPLSPPFSPVGLCLKGHPKSIPQSTRWRAWLESVPLGVPAIDLQG